MTDNIDDIFPSSDDESVAKPVATSSANVDLDDIFDDSQSTPARSTGKRGTLSGLFDSDDDDSGGANPVSKSKPSRGDDLFDSDNESEGSAPKKRKRLGMSKKRSLPDSDSDDSDGATFKKKKLEKRIKKKDKKLRPQREKRLKTSSEPRPKTDGNDSGDDYDSGNEVKRTKEDDDFLAGESDAENADVMREYDQDRQDFDDERPRSKSSKHKSGATSSSSSSGRGKSTGGTDPFSVALANLKAKKIEQWSDTEKQMYVDRLQVRMRDACKKDDDIMALNRARAGTAPPQPALHKIEMLETVKHALSMSMLWNTMLERDILATLAYWIRPRADQSLPALSIRTAIYEALLKLPCMSDQLKKSSMIGELFVKPIGHVIFELIKHKQETPENKKLLRVIVEKWSRDIFSKGTEVVQTLSAYRNDAEIHTRLAAKYDSAAQARLKDEEEAKYQKDNHQRARAPMILGHMFTVQPDIDKQASQRAKKKLQKDDEAIEVPDSSAHDDGSGGGRADKKLMMDSGRAALLKRMEGSGRGNNASQAIGAKRAVNVSVARPSYDFH